MIKAFLIVGIGSFFGGGIRFLISRYMQQGFEHQFPFGTFLVNIIGCLLIGVFYGLFEKGNLLNPDLRLFLTVGFCGSFTTFSTFINENFLLFKETNYIYTALYISLSLFIGFFALFSGYELTK